MSPLFSISSWISSSLARHRPGVLGLVLASLGLLLAGCGGSFKLSGILVTIVEVKPATAATTEKDLTLVLRYTNENLVPIAASGSTHKLYLNGTYVGKVVSEEPIGMPQLGAVNQTTTFKIDNLTLLNQLKASAASQTASYRLESRIKVISGEEETEVKALQDGKVDLSPVAKK